MAGVFARGTPRAGLALGTLLALLACAAIAAEDAPPGQLEERVVEHAGRTRRAWVFVPASLAERPGPAPVLLALHGGGGSALGFREYAGLEPVAHRERFIVVYPEGTSRPGWVSGRFHTWNAGACCGSAASEDVDDVGFLLALVDALARDRAIDTARVYVTGHSNGAMMAYRVASEAADRIAAIVPVGGAMQVSVFAPTRAVPILHVHSIDDPRALYAGGTGPPFPMTSHRVEHRAVEGELARWADVNGCEGELRGIEQRRAPDDRADAGHSAELLGFGACTRAPVLLWRLTGAGHGWPGRAALEGTPRRRVRLIGPSTAVIEVAEEIWKFVSKHALPTER